MSKPRGFAAMTAEQRKAISSKGGKGAHAKGTAHEFTPEEAREAGRKGGRASHAKKAAVEAAVVRLAPSAAPADPPEVVVEDQVLDSACCSGVDPTPSAVKADEVQRNAEVTTIVDHLMPVLGAIIGGIAKNAAKKVIEEKLGLATLSEDPAEVVSDEVQRVYDEAMARS